MVSSIRYLTVKNPQHKIAPTYTSVAKMYIVSASDDSVVDLTDLNIGKALTLDYEDLMLSYPVLDQVIEQLDLDKTHQIRDNPKKWFHLW